jgi:protein-disulfide isomerase
MNRTPALLYLLVKYVLVVGAIAVILRPTGPVGAVLTSSYEEFSIKWKIIALWPELIGTGELLTSSAAKPDMVVFSDYRCSHCAKLDAALDTVTLQIRTLGVVVRHYPLDGLHPDSPEAAKLAICMAQQKHELFGVFHKELFRGLRPTIQEVFTSWPDQMDGSSVKELQACMRHPETIRRIETDRNMAKRLGVNSVPTMFFNGKRVRGARTADELMKLLLPVVRN